jgi:hypothetical protein
VSKTTHNNSPASVYQGGCTTDLCTMYARMCGTLLCPGSLAYNVVFRLHVKTPAALVISRRIWYVYIQYIHPILSWKLPASEELIDFDSHS